MTERTIASLCQRSHELSRSKGWYNGEEKDPRPIRLITLLMQSELIEALEEWRSNRKFDEVYFTGRTEKMEFPKSSFEEVLKMANEAIELKDWKPEGILIELADCIIRIAQRCGSDDIPMQAIIEKAVPKGLLLGDFEEVLATAMADISVSYLVTTPGGKGMAEAAALPTKPEFYWACAWESLFQFCEKNKLDLWSAIELKEKYNATRPHRHGGKKA
jgi:hypothetical protein